MKICGQPKTLAWAVLAVTAIILLFLGAYPIPLCQAGDDILPFEPDDTLEEIRYKIDHNGYSFTVSDNPIFSMPPEEKAAFFSRRLPRQPRALTASDEIGPLAAHLGKRALPSSFDWRNYGGHSYIGPVRDQGDCGSCYAFGAVAAAEGTYNFANGLYGSNRIEFSESYIAWCLGRIFPYSSHFFGCDGADYDYYELQALVDRGIILRSQFPYRETDPGSCAYWGLSTTKFASWHRVPCNDIDAIKTAIMTYGVVDAAVLTTSAFMSYSGGVYEDSHTSCSESPCYYVATDHAIALVGWDDSPPEGGGGVWILRNSWGDTSWGEDGYMRIRYTSARVACAVSYLVYGSSPTSSSRAPLQLYAGDFNGNGKSDLAIFRNGLWRIRGVTRAYFGQSEDIPVPADFNGDGCSDLAVFRPTSGLWSVRGATRFYFGQSGDYPIPMNYRSGSTVAGIFRPSTGLWSFRGGGRVYFGQSGDTPVPGPWVDRSGKWGQVWCGIFRPSSGLWATQAGQRFYFGQSGDTPAPGAYTTSSIEPWKAAIFRSSNGLWQVRGVTRAYFGQAGDIPVPADYIGYWGDEMAIFRPSTGLWSIRGGNRYYFGQSGDTPVTR